MSVWLQIEKIKENVNDTTNSATLQVERGNPQGSMFAPSSSWPKQQLTVEIIKNKPGFNTAPRWLDNCCKRQISSQKKPLHITRMNQHSTTILCPKLGALIHY